MQRIPRSKLGHSLKILCSNISQKQEEETVLQATFLAFLGQYLLALKLSSEGHAQQNTVEMFSCRISLSNSNNNRMTQTRDLVNHLAIEWSQREVFLSGLSCVAKIPSVKCPTHQKASAWPFPKSLPRFVRSSTLV